MVAPLVLIALLFTFTAGLGVYLARKAEATPPPEPEPEPTPDPKPDPLPDAIPWTTLRGANYRNTLILARKERGPTTNQVDATHCDRQIAAAKAMGLNLWRVVLDWEGAVETDGKTIRPVFLQMLDYVCRKCKENGIWVWIDFHQFFCSSHVSKRGDGFPRYIIEKIHTGEPADKEVDDTATSPASKFWPLYYTNKIPGLNVWDEQSKFMLAIVDTVDRYSNVIGYEILNEPHFYKHSDPNWYYEQCGKMQSYIGNKIREKSDKYVIFTRETLHGGGDWQPQSRHLMTPRLNRLPNKVWWTPHHYAPPMSAKGKENLRQYLDTWNEIQKPPYNLKIPIMAFGECATQSNQYCPVDPVTKKILEGAGQCPALQQEAAGYQNMLNMVKDCRVNNVIPVYWQMGSGGGLGNRLTDAGSGTLTEFGQRYKRAITEVYG